MPYQGLAPYSEDDAGFFFGRESEREIIIANVMASRLTVLYGPSGVGKSSVLSAGVSHRLRSHTERAGEDARVAVTVFRDWEQLDLVGRLVADVKAAAGQTGKGVVLGQGSHLDDQLRAVATRFKGNLVIILDQFEALFEYHPEDDGPGSFVSELPRAVNDPDLDASFLISIREDALSRLDQFEELIPFLFENFLRLDHLSEAAAIAAIRQPIDRYNQLCSARNPYEVDDDLVGRVLAELQNLGRVEAVLRSLGGPETQGPYSPRRSRVEAAYLQLVMTRLWREMVQSGSRRLEAASLEKLGGVERIVVTELDDSMNRLTEKEKAVAAEIFYYLVTPSGGKIALTASDLAKWARLSEREVSPVLRKLSGGDRILRQVVPLPGLGPESRYEIFHDVLAKGVLAWRDRSQREQLEKQLALAKEMVEPAATRPESTDFSRDVMGRYLCNSLDEALRSVQTDGTGLAANPFDVIVLGGGSFGATLAVELFLRDMTHSHRVLVLEAGPFVVSEHVQDLALLCLTPPTPTTIDDLRSIEADCAPRAEVWGLPWHSATPFPGLAYCLGGRSLYWSGWSLQPLPSELRTDLWPAAVLEALDGEGDGYWGRARKLLAVDESIGSVLKNLQGELWRRLHSLISAELPHRSRAHYETSGDLAPGAVGAGALRLSSHGRRFSVLPQLVEGARLAYRESEGDDAYKRLMVVPNCHVKRLDVADGRVVAVETAHGIIPVPAESVVVLALGTIESTRLALVSFANTATTQPIGLGLFSHLRSTLIIRLPASRLGLSPSQGLETAAIWVRGRYLHADGDVGHFHLQVTASGLGRATGEQLTQLFRSIPDFDLFEAHSLASEDHVVIAIRGVGEMDANNPNNRVVLHQDLDEYGIQRAAVALGASARDENLWDAMDAAVDDLVVGLARGEGYELLTPGGFVRVPDGQKPRDVLPYPSRRDGIGSTHDEAGTLRLGDLPATSVVNCDCRFHGVANAYVASPAVFPSIGSSGPMLSGMALTQRLVDRLNTQPDAGPLEPGFVALFDGTDRGTWRTAGSGHFMLVKGVLTAVPGEDLGIHWCTIPLPPDFILKVEWSISSAFDNAGVLIRFPDPRSRGYRNEAWAAVDSGLEIRIDEQGRLDGLPMDRTALYGQPDQVLSSQPTQAGAWNAFEIRAQGQEYMVSLNGATVSHFVNRDDNRAISSRTVPTYMGVHVRTGLVRFRNIRVMAV